MRIIKYEHACLVIEEGEEQLIIDPGTLSPSFKTPVNPVALVITHIHADHFDKEKVTEMLQKFPKLRVVTIADVAAGLPDSSQVQTVKPDEKVQVGNLNLQFFGEDHAIIHPDAPQFKNSGVLVNDNLYYPGDSFTIPGATVTTLAVPVSGPWLKTAESIDFMLAVKPKRAFPTHDALLSEIGVNFTNDWLKRFGSEQGIDYTPLEIGQSTKLD